MKLAVVFLACSLSVHSAIAEAGACRPLEYAEIKDTPSKDLVKTYCYYDGMAKIYDEARTSSRELFLRQMQQTPTSVQILEDLRRGWERTTAEQTADIKECHEQQAKIETALKARLFKGNLACSTPPTGSLQP